MQKTFLKLGLIAVTGGAFAQLLAPIEADPSRDPTARSSTDMPPVAETVIRAEQGEL